MSGARSPVVSTSSSSNQPSAADVSCGRTGTAVPRRSECISITPVAHPDGIRQNLRAQTQQALALARDHGFGEIPIEVLEGTKHRPLATFVVEREVAGSGVLSAEPIALPCLRSRRSSAANLRRRRWCGQAVK